MGFSSSSSSASSSSSSLLGLFDYACSSLGDVEFFWSESNGERVSFAGDIFKSVECEDRRGIGLRVIHDARVGFSFSNDFMDRGIVGRARDSSVFGEEALFSFVSGFNGGGAGGVVGIIEDSSLYSSDMELFSISKMLSMGEEAIDTIKSFNSSINVDIVIEKERLASGLMTGNGFCGEYVKSLFSIFVSCMLVRGDEFLLVSRSFLSLSPIVSVLGLTDFIIGRYRWLMESSVIKTGYYSVIFTPRAFKFLVSVLISGTDGKLVSKGISPLVDKLGTRFLSEGLTIIDDGSLSGGISTVPFDGEGVLSRENILFDRGELKTFIYDLRTGGVMGEESTASGVRTYSSVPVPGFSNIVVRSGDKSFSELLSLLGDGILVDSFIGAGQSNVMAGEFAMNMELAFRVSGASICGRIKDGMISGNVYKVFTSVVLGDKLYREGSGYYPYALLEGLAISSKA